MIEQRKGGGVLGEEGANPVRGMMNVEDLEIFSKVQYEAFIAEAESGAATPPEGLRPSADVVKDTCDVLLRYLGELKHVYYRYRSTRAQYLKRPGEDPLTMSALQFLLLLRDMNCLTPTCSLAIANRVTQPTQSLFPARLGQGLEQLLLGEDVGEVDAQAATDVHSPDRELLFRHFLEGLVRVAPVRLPFLPSLSAQVEVLVKGGVLPLLSLRSSPSLKVFEFMMPNGEGQGSSIVQVLNEYGETLQKYFCSLSADQKAKGGDVTCGLKKLLADLVRLGFVKPFINFSSIDLSAPDPEPLVVEEEVVVAEEVQEKAPTPESGRSSVSAGQINFGGGGLSSLLGMGKMTEDALLDMAEVKVEVVKEVPPALEEVMLIDWSRLAPDLVAVAMIFTETLSPSSLGMFDLPIRVKEPVSADSSPMSADEATQPVPLDSTLKLSDWIESTELTFFEFLRFVVRYVDTVTRAADTSVGAKKGKLPPPSPEGVSRRLSL